MAKAVQPKKLYFSQAMQTEKYKKLINNTLGDPVRAARFAANITSAVAVNPTLQECDAGTILAGALLGESLLLQPSPQLGQFYLVPFESKAKRDRQGNVIKPACLKAQFVLGYKGYIQLALRTGQYKRLNVLEVKSGELGGWDPFEERFHEMHFIEDFEKRAAMPTVGYSQCGRVYGVHSELGRRTLWPRKPEKVHQRFSAAHLQFGSTGGARHRQGRNLRCKHGEDGQGISGKAFPDR